MYQWWPLASEQKEVYFFPSETVIIKKETRKKKHIFVYKESLLVLRSVTKKPLESERHMSGFYIILFKHKVTSFNFIGGAAAVPQT